MMRTVKRISLELNKKKKAKVGELCKAYSGEKNHFLDVFKELRFQVLLDEPRTIRDEFVDKGYKSRYGLQARHWKLAQSDAVETWDKYWKSILSDVRSKIANHKEFSEEQRKYAYFLIRGYPQLMDVMKGKVPDAPNLSIEARKSVAGYIKRSVQKVKGKNPSVKKATSVKFDQDCYSVYEENGTQYIELMSLEPRKRIKIPLSGKGKIEGTITVILIENKIEIHIPQEIKKSKPPQGPLEAVDFGYTEVMTDTSGKRYGTEFGKTLTEASNNLHEKGQKRNKLRSIQKSAHSKKAANIRKYNLGSKKQKETRRKTQASLKKEICTAINNVVKEKKPSVLVTENLRHTFTYNKPKSVNRKLSSWTRGELQDIVEFKALTKGFRHQQVNPAYCSQVCPSCDFVDRENRKGDKFVCLHCGHEGVADQIAAMNLSRRCNDEEIGLYMPHSQVKIVLLERFHRRLETEKSVTVPGRTPDTVSDVCLQHPSRYKSQQGEFNSLDLAVPRRAKQNEHV